MTDSLESLQKQVNGLTQALLALAHDMEKVEVDCDLTATLHRLGSALKLLLPTPCEEGVLSPVAD